MRDFALDVSLVITVYDDATIPPYRGAWRRRLQTWLDSEGNYPLDGCKTLRPGEPSVAERPKTARKPAGSGCEKNPSAALVAAPAPDLGDAL